MTNEIKVNIPEVIGWIKDGMERKDIAKNLSISMAYARETVFQHPDVKGVRKPQKTQTRPVIVFEGSTTPVEEAPSEETVSESITETNAEIAEEVSAQAEEAVTIEAEVEEAEETEEVEEAEEVEAEEVEEESPATSGMNW